MIIIMIINTNVLIVIWLKTVDYGFTSFFRKATISIGNNKLVQTTSIQMVYAISQITHTMYQEYTTLWTDAIWSDTIGYSAM